MKYELSRRIEELDPNHIHWRKEDAIQFVTEAIFRLGDPIGITILPEVKCELNDVRIMLIADRLKRKYRFFLSPFACISDIVTDLLPILKDAGITIMLIDEKELT